MEQTFDEDDIHELTNEQKYLVAIEEEEFMNEQLEKIREN
jgi:hypothetical protein